MESWVRALCWMHLDFVCIPLAAPAPLISGKQLGGQTASCWHYHSRLSQAEVSRPSCSAYTPPNGCDSPASVPALLCFVHRGAQLGRFHPLTQSCESKAFFSDLSAQRDTRRADVLRKHPRAFVTTALPALGSAMNAVTSTTSWVFVFLRLKLPALSNQGDFSVSSASD